MPWLLPMHTQGIRVYVLSALAIFIVLATYLSVHSSSVPILSRIQTLSPDFEELPTDQRLPREVAANATLGFQAILALTLGTRWRLSGLEAAAAYTGLSIETTTQPSIDEKTLTDFQEQGGEGGEHPGRGSAKAWLGHLNLLKRVVDERMQSVLIIEDDADWDVWLRKQMKPLSDGARSMDPILKNHNSSMPENSFILPYGLSWDVLWLGNCGEDVTPSVENGDMSSWYDRTAIDHEQYIGWAKMSVNLLQPGHRAVVRAHGPVCTFAYAVTLGGARRVLDLASNGQSQAFDTKLGALCRSGELNCLSVAPELIHEYRPPALDEGSITSEVDSANRGGTTPTDEDSILNKMGSTQNIVNSARCRALFDATCVAT